METQNIIIVKPQGYCGGVLKAIETAKKQEFNIQIKRLPYWVI